MWITLFVKNKNTFEDLEWLFETCYVSQAETIPLVRPYLETMTLSELHCLMTSGFATVAGSTLAAYISFGVCFSFSLSLSPFRYLVAYLIHFVYLFSTKTMQLI